MYIDKNSLIHKDCHAALAMTKNLENIYISPLELCNLRCLYCYTDKTKTILSNDQVLTFISDYQKALFKINSTKLKTIIFCGGEVFTLKDFPSLINSVQSLGIFVSVITNGVIDHLDEIQQPHNCQLIVSFDGPQKIHDQNRGVGNFQKSKDFVNSALQKGFPVEIFYLITKESYPHKDKLDIYNQHITYLTDRLGSLTKEQEKEIRTNYPCYPPQDFGCNVFSLQSNGKFYGCCESSRSIGNLDDPLEPTIHRYLDIITRYPKCSDPDYWCGLK